MKKRRIDYVNNRLGKYEKRIKELYNKVGELVYGLVGKEYEPLDYLVLQDIRRIAINGLITKRLSPNEVIEMIYKLYNVETKDNEDGERWGIPMILKDILISLYRTGNEAVTSVFILDVSRTNFISDDDKAWILSWLSDEIACDYCSSKTVSDILEHIKDLLNNKLNK